MYAKLSYLLVGRGLDVAYTHYEVVLLDGVLADEILRHGLIYLACRSLKYSRREVDGEYCLAGFGLLHGGNVLALHLAYGVDIGVVGIYKAEHSCTLDIAPDRTVFVLQESLVLLEELESFLAADLESRCAGNEAMP